MGALMGSEIATEIFQKLYNFLWTIPGMLVVVAGIFVYGFYQYVFEKGVKAGKKKTGKASIDLADYEPDKLIKKQKDKE
jgi:heme/copper-type cytochrome/quinol oxidase subunit 2